MSALERDWWRVEPPGRADRVWAIVRRFGPEASMSHEDLVDLVVWFGDPWDAPAEHRLVPPTLEDLALADQLLEIERARRARQVAALERLGAALAGRAGTIDDQILALVEAVASPDVGERQRAREGVLALGELGWRAAAPADPWVQEVREEWDGARVREVDRPFPAAGRSTSGARARWVLVAVVLAVLITTRRGGRHG